MREKIMDNRHTKKVGAAIAGAVISALVIMFFVSPARAQSAADYYHKAMDYQKTQGDLQKAIEEMKKAVQAEPNTAAYHTALGDMYFDAQDCNNATAEMKTAIKLDNRMFTAHNVLAACYARAGKNNEAVTEYTAALALNIADNSETAAIYDRIGFVRHSAGSTAEAESFYKQSIQTDPGLPDPHKHLCKLYYEQQKMDDAIQQCRAAVDLAPSDPEAHYNYSFLLAAAGKYQEALAEMDATLKIVPNDPGFLESRQQLESWAKEPATYDSGGLKGVPQEITYKTPIEEIYGLEKKPSQPENQPPAQPVAVAQNNPPQPAQPKQNQPPEQPRQQPPVKQAQQPPAAEKQRPMQEKPAGKIKSKKYGKEDLTPEQLAADYFKAAKYNLGNGQNASAERDIKRALAIFPNNTDYLTAHGLIMIQRGDFDSAANTLNGVLKDNPVQSTALDSLGYAQDMMGQRDDADGNFSNALAADATNGCAAANVAASLARKADCGDITSQRGESALSNGCRQGAVHNTMALCFLMNGNIESARKHAFKAVKLDPRNPVIKENYNFLVKKSGVAAEKVTVVEKEAAPYFEVGSETKDIPLANLVPVIVLDFNKVFNDTWKTKTVLVMPFENPRGIRKTKRTPSDIYTEKAVQSFKQSGYFIPVAPGKDRIYTFEELQDTNRLKSLAQRYNADLIFVGRLGRATLTEKTEKVLYGIKKKNSIDAMTSMDTVIYEAATGKPIIKSKIDGISELPGMSIGEITYFQNKDLSDKSFDDYLNNVEREILDHYNLLRYPIEGKIVRFIPEGPENAKSYHW